MSIVCIILGAAFIAGFSAMGLAGAHLISKAQILGQSLLQFIGFPNELSAFLVLGVLGLFIGIVSGFPLIMHGVILRRIARIEDALLGDSAPESVD